MKRETTLERRIRRLERMFEMNKKSSNKTLPKTGLKRKRMSEDRLNKKYANRRRKNESFGNGLRPEDWTIVNTEDDGGYKHYGVHLWPGAGYQLIPYSVWADDEWEALNLVADYCKENNPGMIATYDEVFKDVAYDMVRAIEEDPEEYGFTEEQLENADDEDIVMRLKSKDYSVYQDLYDEVWSNSGFDDMYISVDDPTIFLPSENLRMEKWPDDYPSPEDAVR